MNIKYTITFIAQDSLANYADLASPKITTPEDVIDYLTEAIAEGNFDPLEVAASLDGVTIKLELVP